jgi:hypothetical protein
MARSWPVTHGRAEIGQDDTPAFVLDDPGDGLTRPPALRCEEPSGFAANPLHLQGPLKRRRGLSLAAALWHRFELADLRHPVAPWHGRSPSALAAAAGLPAPVVAGVHLLERASRRLGHPWREQAPGKYGTAEFDTVSRLLSDADACRSKAELSRLVLARRREWAMTLRHLAALPTATVTVSELPSGDRVWDQLTKRRLRIRTAAIAVAAVVIPEDPATLLRGRSRQALRTNLRHAEQLGTTYLRLSGTPEECERLRELGLKGGLDMSAAEMHFWITQRPDLFVAIDRTQTYVAAYCLDVDTETALLSRVMTAPGREGLYARYGLHVHVVRELARRNVRMLCVGAAYTSPARLQYVQHLLGFLPTNVIVSRDADAGTGTASVE